MMMLFADRDTYNHPGPLGPALDLSRVTGVDLHHTAAPWTGDVLSNLYGIANYTYRTWGRSSYNFAIHPADPGTVYEMQGLHIGAHNDGENSTRLGLVVLGNYDQATPTDAVVDTAGRFVGHAHEQGWTTRLHVKGHRDTDSTSCPGTHLYRRLPDIRTIAAQEDDMPLTDDDLDRIARRLFEQPLIHADDVSVLKALDRTYRAGQHNQAALRTLLGRDGDVDVSTLAAEIAGLLDDRLAAAVADELNRRLQS